MHLFVGVPFLFVCYLLAHTRLAVIQMSESQFSLHHWLLGVKIIHFCIRFVSIGFFFVVNFFGFRFFLFHLIRFLSSCNLNRLKLMSISSRHLQHQSPIPSIWSLLCRSGIQQRILVWCHSICNSKWQWNLALDLASSSLAHVRAHIDTYRILQTTPPEPPDSNVTKLRINSPVRTSHSLTVPSSDDVITNRELNCKHVTADWCLFGPNQQSNGKIIKFWCFWALPFQKSRDSIQWTWSSLTR